ncbi:MAG: alpha/beta hydrolase [Micropepsaceae bacterium]
MRVRCSDVDCWVERHGEGPPVLLLHGYPQHGGIWDAQVETLKRTHSVFVPDLPGWGRSPAPAHLDYGYDSELARLKALTDALALERFTLVGHDYGGFLGLGYAIRWGERVTGLAILNSRAHGVFAPGFYALQDGLARLTRPALLRHIVAALPLRGIFRHSLLRFARAGQMNPGKAADYAAHLAAYAARLQLAKFWADYDVRPRAFLVEGVPRLRCPISLIWGRDDPFVPVSIAEDFVRLAPHATLTVIENTGHFIVDQRPAEVSDALLALLRTVDTAPRSAGDLAH